MLDNDASFDRAPGEQRSSFANTAQEVEQARNELQLKGTLRELFSVAIFRRNLILMIIVWSFCTFSFFVVPYYLDTIPGNLFLMSTSTAVAEILASLICLAVTGRYDTRKTVAFFALISCVGTVGIILLTSTYKGTSQAPDAVGYLVQYTGFVSTFNTVYVLVNELFPTIFLATAYGACNVIGRAVSISSPLVARVSPPWPMMILAVYSAICTFIPLIMVKVKSSPQSEQKKN